MIALACYAVGALLVLFCAACWFVLATNPHSALWLVGMWTALIGGLVVLGVGYCVDNT